MKLLPKDLGFTLIELLIVVVVLSALTGITISVINPASTQGAARDGIRNANITRLAESLTSYKLLERSLPENADISDDASIFMTQYLNIWPEGVDNNGNPDPLWDYNYRKLSTTTYVITTKNAFGNGCYKFYSTWENVLDCSQCSFEDTCE